MKKVLFLSLLLAAGTTGFAQKNQDVKVGKNQCIRLEQKKAFGKETSAETSSFAPVAGAPATAHYGSRYDSRVDFETMVTQMDLQSNAFVANRMWRFDDGSVGVVTTFPSNGSDRGTGYNFYDGNEFGEQPDVRIEGIKTGWPSYCQYGPNGELVMAHTGSDLVYYTRATKGEGEWVGPKYVPNPELGFPDEDLTWPRVITSGPNHDIIHVVAASQDSDNISYNFYGRSTDGENWTVTTVPTFNSYERFTADSYALAVNGNTVAMLFCGAAPYDAFIVKSTDNGENWNRITVWKNPYSHFENWDEEPSALFGEEHPMYCPENGTLCIDNNGMVHAAFSSWMITHEDRGDGVGVYIWSGLTASEGIFYWNENMGVMQAPEWTCPEDGYVLEPDPHNVFRLWYPTSEADEYVRRNFDQPLIGFVDPLAAQEWSNDNFHHERDYNGHWLGCSCTPAICVDAEGTIAIAYSVVDPTRVDASSNKYYRSVFVSYIDSPYNIGDALNGGTEEGYTDYQGDYYYNIENLQDIDDEDWGFFHSMDEALFVNGISNTVNREYWFAFQADQMVGLNIGNGATQTAATENILWAVKIVPESPVSIEENEVVNPMTNTRVYPNPATSVLNIEVNASQSSDMNIAVFNITGQKVMEKNVNINAGINTPSISTTDLSSGIYFVTVKANGFENTMKFIVK